MNMKHIRLFILCGVIAIFACNQPVTKKVLIMGRGQITTQDNNITMSDGSGYTEETVDIAGDKPVTWNVTTPAGKTTVNIPQEKGFYIFNLKTDTLVGSQQLLGTDLSSGRTITQEELKVKIDSLTKLTTGENVSLGGRNYFVLPNQLIKVSSNIEARVFGPFTKVSSTLEPNKDGSTPEIYKFYTNSEMRQLIDNFKKMTY